MILMGMSVAAALKIKRDVLIGRCRLQATQMEHALEVYRDNRGFLPCQPDGEVDKDDESYENANVVRQIRGFTESEAVFRPGPSELNSSGSYKDAWGRPFRVAIWKERPTDDFYRCCRVYSCGPNRHWDGGNKGPYTDGSGKRVIGDDIPGE